MTLKASATDQQFIVGVRAYLHDVLGAEARVQPWSDLRKLPYFLQDAFELHGLELCGRAFVLASARQGNSPTPSTLRTQLDRLSDIAGRPVVFAANTLASYERKRLVEQKVPFVVPGNQLYLPDLGIDFREYFRQPTVEVRAFTPATQAIFITTLLRRSWQGEWRPADTVADMGYTAMTFSRAVRELTAAGLVTARQEGRARCLRTMHGPAEAWQHAKPFLRSPVKRNVGVSQAARAHLPEAPLAGLSALAACSMLTEPPRPVFAVSTVQWKAAQQAGVAALPESRHSDVQLQVWSYAPNLQKEGRMVDPLSLTLSLQDVQDERVQKALEELRGRYPW